MPFLLKNDEAMYQRMMTRMFRDEIGCTVEVYIADMVVKSKQEIQHIGDLKEEFEVLDGTSYALMLINALSKWGWQVPGVFDH